MNRLFLKKVVNRLAILLFCVALFFYTMAFPGTSSWFILIFFVLLFLILFLSTLFSWGQADASLLTNSDHSENLRISLVTHPRLPIFLPRLTIRVLLKESQYEREVPIYFRNRLTVQFDQLTLPRGHYDEVTVQSFGKDHFGFFNHATSKRIRVAFDIYPKRLAPNPRTQLMQHLRVTPFMKQLLYSHSSQFRQIRDYIPQDTLKSVDWKTSSRKQKLMVKEYEKDIQPILTLVFWGGESQYFEELLRLIYTLYLELKNTLQVRLVLLGNVDQMPAQKEDMYSFLTVEPAPDSEMIMSYFRKMVVPHGHIIVVAPKSYVGVLRSLRTEQLLFLTEAEVRSPYE